MNRKEFFDYTCEVFFEELTSDFEGFKEMVSGVLPVFGTLETFVDTEEGETVISFFDNDEEGLTAILVLLLGEKNEIVAVEHKMELFTQANKEIVLFAASLVGKIITFK